MSSTPGSVGSWRFAELTAGGPQSRSQGRPCCSPAPPCFTHDLLQIRSSHSPTKGLPVTRINPKPVPKCAASRRSSKSLLKPAGKADLRKKTKGTPEPDSKPQPPSAPEPLMNDVKLHHIPYPPPESPTSVEQRVGGSLADLDFVPKACHNGTLEANSNPPGMHDAPSALSQADGLS